MHLIIARRRISTQTLLALLLSGVTLVTLGASWPHWASLLGEHGQQPIILIALGLIIGGIYADLHPIHVYYHTKVAVTTVPLFILAVLLRPLAAASAAAFIVLISELLANEHRGNDAGFVVASTGRWLLLAFVGSWLTHVPATTDAIHTFWLCAGAATMLVGDICLTSVEVATMSREPVWLVIVGYGRGGSQIEAILYLLGILGVWLADGHLWRLAMLVVPMIVVHRAFKHAREMRESTGRLLESLADAVDLRDPYTGGHSRRVTEFCQVILRELSLEGIDAAMITMAARVHDIGKIGVPDEVLKKPGPLTEEEWALMATHPEKGAQLLVRYPDFARGVEVVRHHHERWDGKGYPSGLAGFAIPFGARVIAVADSFDAMTSDRPYRAGMSPAKAIAVLREDHGRQWDPEIVTAFLRAIDKAVEQPQTSGLMRVQSPAT